MIRCRLFAAWAALAVTASFSVACGGHESAPARSDVRQSGHAEKVVSLIPSVTLIMFELGAGDRLVGVTRYCERPPQARAITRVGGILDVSVEAVAAVRPDLVIGSPAVLTGRLVEILEPAGVRFLPLAFEDFDDVRAAVVAIGSAVGREDAAGRMVRKFDDGLASLDYGMPRLRALFVVGTRPLVVAGPSSFQGQIMSAMGLENAVGPGGPNFPTWSLEQVIKAAPDIVIDGIAGGEPSAEILSEAGIGAAVVHIPDEAILLPGPDAVQAAAALATRIRAVAAPKAE